MKLERAAVVGMGKSGQAAARALLARGCTVLAFDESPIAKSPVADGAFTLHAGPLPMDFWKGTDVVVVSPGFPLARAELQAARGAGITVWGEVELAFRLMPRGAGPILGITGTNGKSTTTALVGAMMERTRLPIFVGGNLGTPLCEAVRTPNTPPYAWYIVELSSFQLESVDSFACRGAALLNLTPDHVDRYPDFHAYAEAKGHIFERQPADGFAVLNADDAQAVRLAKRSRAPRYEFGALAESGAIPTPGGFQFTFGRGARFALRNRALRGPHNLQNAMAASLMATCAGVTDDAVQAALDGFAGLPHRLEFVRTLDGVEWVNDSKATNVDSAVVGVSAITGPLWLIAGGKGKGSSYAPLVQAGLGRVRGVLTIGADAPAIEAAFDGASDVYACGTLQKAVALARQLATAPSTVLLSPACASFDQFKSFEHRGDTFRTLVAALAAEERHAAN